MMKVHSIFFKVLLTVLFLSTACSTSDDVEEEIAITKCFVVKVLDTDLPITNTRISFYGRLSCYLGGCGYAEIGTGITNDNGEVCVTLKSIRL